MGHKWRSAFTNMVRSVIIMYTANASFTKTEIISHIPLPLHLMRELGSFLGIAYYVFCPQTYSHNIAQTCPVETPAEDSF